MIIGDKIEIKINKNSKNKNYYRNLGYEINNSTEKIYIKILDLPSNSTSKIKVVCDICGKERFIEYRKYLNNIKKYGYYTCRGKCSREKAKLTGIEKYGDENYNNIKQAQQTCEEKYGVKNPFQVEEFKEKSKQTCIELYGNEIYSKTDECKEKIRKTCIERYDSDSYSQTNECIEKVKKTCLENYGVECSLHNKEINEKMRQNNLIKYGYEIPSESNEIKEKIEKTCLERYGVCFVSKLDSSKEKRKETCIKRYGVEHHMQNEDIFNKQQLSGKFLKLHKDMNLYYRGSYEKDFLDLCFKYNIKVEKIYSFKYDFHKKKYTYFPDFYIPIYDLIVEIKSDYYYNKYLEKNLIKEKCILDYGFNFMFIINKNYELFLKILYSK
jgi:hypothetical protein